MCVKACLSMSVEVVLFHAHIVAPKLFGKESLGFATLKTLLMRYVMYQKSMESTTLISCMTSSPSTKKGLLSSALKSRVEA